MKLLDEKGRLFGKINLVDLLIILLVVLLAVAVIWRVAGSRAPGNVATQDAVIRANENLSVRFKVLISGVDAEYVPGLERYAMGAQIIRDENLINGRIVDVQSHPIGTVLDASGEMIPVEEGERYDVVFTVEYTGRMNTNTLIDGKQVLRVGAEYVLRTVFIEIKGYIADVEIIG